MTLARQNPQVTDQIAPGARTFLVSFKVGARVGNEIAAALGECLDPTDTAVVLSEIDAQTWVIELHFAAEPDADAIRALVAAVAGSEAADSLMFGQVAERDWVAASLAGLAPVVAGRFVVHGAHDRGRAPRRPISIEIEAALAFGTGHHGTTRGCLLALDALLKRRRPRTVLDIGTGTAVLAMAAAKALRRKAVASDIDPVAVRVAQANARANSVGSLIDFACGPGLAPRALRRRAPYDLVLANILLRPLMSLAAPMAKVTAQGGTVILSGLLPAHGQAAIAAYRMAGFRLVRRINVENWTTLHLERGPATSRSSRAKSDRPGRR